MTDAADALRALAHVHSRWRLWADADFNGLNDPLLVFARSREDAFTRSFRDHYKPEFRSPTAASDWRPDFPWWGERYFESSERVLLVAEGALQKPPIRLSVALYAMLWAHPTSVTDPKLGAIWACWPRRKFEEYRALALDVWGLDPARLFVTDAVKTTNQQSSMKLLAEEIGCLAPGRIVTLGRKARDFATQARDLAGSRAEVVASPFPFGRGGIHLPRLHGELSSACRSIWAAERIAEEDRHRRASLACELLGSSLGATRDEFRRALLAG